MLLRHLGQMVLLLAAVNMTIAGGGHGASAAQPGDPVHIVALGDSLTAGYGVAPGKSLPDALQRLLRAKGLSVEIQNAGVSGDTTSGGLARLDWAVPDGTDAVVLALGANDMLGGLPPARAKANLESIVQKLKARNIPILLAGMRASRSLGDRYTDEFDRIYPDLADKYGLILYPFLLDGVALDPKLNQPDGIHPTAEGVEVIAAKMIPAMQELIARAQKVKLGDAK